MAATDITPTGDDFYIVYEDSKKTSYLSSFIVGINRSGNPGTREAYTKYAAADIGTFSNLNAYNNELIELGQPILTWNPYTQQPPDTECNQDNDGNCT
jgi:hypothetical protein